MTELYFFFSRKQLRTEQEHDSSVTYRDTYCEASDGTIIRYTEATSDPDYRSHWDDAVPLCKGRVAGRFDPTVQLVIENPDGREDEQEPCVVPTSDNPYSYYHTHTIGTSGSFTRLYDMTMVAKQPMNVTHTMSAYVVKQLKIPPRATQGDKEPETLPTFTYEEF